MRILILGSGGREHSIGWKLRQSKKVKEIYFSPGNAGTAQIGRNVNIDNSSHKKLISWIKKNKIELKNILYFNQYKNPRMKTPKKLEV